MLLLSESLGDEILEKNCFFLLFCRPYCSFLRNAKAVFCSLLDVFIPISQNLCIDLYSPIQGFQFITAQKLYSEKKKKHNPQP